VCNPATKETVFVPVINKSRFLCCKMGLAYDPCKSPNRCMIVDPELRNHKEGLLYHFNIFRSNTGKWMRSSQSIYIPTLMTAAKPECAKGVIYWLCGEYIIWYDTEKDLGGSLSLPVISEANLLEERFMNMTVYAGEITFCRTWKGGIMLWRLNNGSHWDRLHAASWDSMMDSFNFCHGMRLRNKSWSDVFWRRIVRPVGFDGRYVYIAVRLKYRERTEKIFGWEVKTGRVVEKGIISIKGPYHDEVFCYANSMARVPQILDGTC
jgi:hypothetical protein